MHDLELLPEDPFLSFIVDEPHFAVFRHDETTPPWYEMSGREGFYDLGQYDDAGAPFTDVSATRYARTIYQSERPGLS